MSKKYLVTWDMLQIHGRELAEHVLQKQQWKGIIGVSRGGLVPATILARELNIRNVDTLCIASYHEYQQQTELKVLKQPLLEDGGKDYIIVDDLVDSGNTAKKIRELYPNAYFVTVFAKPVGKPYVDHYIVDIPQDTWIEQPWDTGVQYIKPLCE